MKNSTFLKSIKIFSLFCSFILMPILGYAQAPTTASSNLSFSSIDGNRMRLNFTEGNGERRLIIAKAGSPVTAIPVDGIEYLDGDFGEGNEIAPGEFVVYNGNYSYPTIYGLNHSTTYYFKIFDFNGSDFSTQYLTSSYLEGSQSTLTNPTTQASNITFSNVVGSTMDVNWTNGDGSGRILIARANEAVNVEPEDLVDYYSWSGAFGNSSYEIGTGNYVLYEDDGNSVNITNLDPNTTYHFALFEYNGNDGKIYLTSTSITNPAAGATGSQATSAYPTINATGMSFDNIDGNRLIFRVYSNQEGNGEKRIVIAKQGSPVTAEPVNGIEYTADNTFGDGQEIAPGEFVIANDDNISSYLYGLQPSTVYYFKVFEYNGSGTNTYYLKTTDANGDPVFEANQSTLTNPTTQASNITFSDVLVTSMTVNWTNGNGSGRILIARANEAVNVEPEDLVDYYSWGGAFGNSSYEIGTGNYVLYEDDGNSVNITNLDPNTTYHFALFEYNGNSGKVYLTSTSASNPAPGATESQSTNAYSNPTINANGMSFDNIDGNRLIFRVYSNQEGNGEKRIVIAKQGSPVTAEPVNGTEYTADNTFGDGQEIAPGEFVIANDDNISSYLYGLQPSTTYYFKVFEYNGSGTNTYYLKTTDANGNPVFEANQSTLSSPTIQTGNVFVNSKTTTSFNINWTNGNGSGRILIARANEPVNVEPQDLTDYYSWSGGFGSSSYEIGTGNYVLYEGNNNSINVTNLQPGTNYHFALFEYNGNSGKVYLRPGYAFEAETFGATPTTQVSNVNFSEIGGTSMQVNFTRGNGSSRLVIAKKGAPVDVQPSDNTTYSADANFGDGQEIGTGNFVVYNGTDEEFQLSNLEHSSTYHFAFFEYAINDNEELYLVPGATASQATPAPPTIIPSDFTYSRPCDSDLILTWTSGNGQGRLVILSESPLNTAPINSTDYTANFGYGMGDAIGNGYVVYNGAGNLVPPNLLQASTNYYVNIYEYNGTKMDPVFNMTPLQGFIGDITIPDVSCQDIQVVLDDTGNVIITAEDVGTIPTGDCGTVSAEIDISTFDCSNLGPNDVTLTITDSDGNTNSCVSTVTVVDQTAPTVITKNISTQLDTNGTASIAEDAVNNSSTDACGSLSFDTDITTFNSSDVGENTVTLTVTDGSNNSSSATAIVTVIDIPAPANDNLCDAVPLTMGTTSAGDAFTNVSATIQTDEPIGSCWNGSGTKTVWFSFEAPASGNVAVSTDIAGGTLTDTHIAIYGAPTDCNDLTTLNNEVGCDGEGGVIVPHNSIATMTGLIPGTTYYIQVEGYNSQTGTFGIEVMDNGCLTPTNLSVDNITETTADIAWTEHGSATQWELAYGNTGFDPNAPGGLSVIVNGSPQTALTGLAGNTSYDAYARSLCGGDGPTEWMGPVTFTTSCLGSPTLTFLGTGEFQNSIVAPTQGTPETNYEFAVIYTNNADVLPPYGFPRVILDYEGNGNFTNTNDRAVILSAADPNDTETADGKVYVGS
ncbi:MAG TPA: hypothetical protein VFM82_05600, partial [Flavobacteriaceae bacterium]|nr:hypothetical protein [Flavobacteriaceae bacterium]